MPRPSNPPFEWTEAREALARQGYVERCKPASWVARSVCHGCTTAHVLALVEARGWAAGRELRLKAPRFRPEAVAMARRMYVDDGAAPSAIARTLGAPFTAAKIRALAKRQGWSAARPKAVTLRVLRQVQLDRYPVRPHRAVEPMQASVSGLSDGSRPAQGAAAARSPKASLDATVRAGTTLGKGSTPGPVPLEAEDLPRLIAEAVAAGKVTVLPCMPAAGLSGLETRFWAVGVGGSWKAQADALKRAAGVA